MLAPEWTWWACLPVLLVTAVVLYAPGVAVLAALRLRAWTVVAAAPLVSVTLVGLGGLLAWAGGVPWTPATYAALSVLLVGAAWAIGRRRPGPGLGLTRLDAHRFGAVVLAAAIIGRVIQVAAVRPGNFPQNPDMIFHLDLTRWFVEHLSASSLDASLGVASPVQFYPAALHGVAATVSLATAAPPIIALTCVQLLFVCVAWPAALLALLAALTPATWQGTWLAGLLATAVPVFPYRLIGYGPLWPFDAALALVPVWLALLVAATRPPEGRTLAPGPLLLALATAPGLALLHSGVALTVVIPGWFLAGQWALSRATAGLGRGRTPLRLAVALSLPALVALGAVRAPEGMVVATNQAPAPLPQVLAEASRLWGGGTDATWAAAVVLIVLMGLGAVAGLRHAAWLIATTATFAVLAILLHLLGTDWARWLFWPWQNVVERLRVVTGAFGIVLASLGLAWVATLGGAERLRRASYAAFVACAALAAWLSSVSFATNTTTLGNYYRGAARIPWLTAAEADALREVSRALPDDAVVIADPYNGGTFLAVVGPERMLIPTEKTNSDDLQLITDRLDRLATDPRVCRVLAEHAAFYLLTGGDPASRAWHGDYSSFERAAGLPGVTPLLTAGPYTLHRIDACPA